MTACISNHVSCVVTEKDDCISPSSKNDEKPSNDLLLESVSVSAVPKVIDNKTHSVPIENKEKPMVSTSTGTSPPPQNISTQVNSS